MTQLIRALHLLMKHKVFRFGTTWYRQKDGIAIGVPLATDWATQILAFHETTVLQDLFGKYLSLDKMFVDDKIGTLKIIPNSKTYNDCENHPNKVCKLNWEAPSVSNQVIFLDLIIWIDRKVKNLNTNLVPKTKISFSTSRPDQHAPPAHQKEW